MGHRHGASLGGLPTSSRLGLANVQARTGNCAGITISRYQENMYICFLNLSAFEITWTKLVVALLLRAIYDAQVVAVCPKFSVVSGGLP